MLTKETAKKVLLKCLETGADFSELFVENTISNSITMVKGVVYSSTTDETYGIGIRILKGTKEVYGYTSDLKEESLLKLATVLSKSYAGTREIEDFSWKEAKASDITPIEIHPKNVKEETKIEYLRRGYNAVKDTPELVQIMGRLQDRVQEVEIYNSNGTNVKDTRCYVRWIIQTVASDSKDMQSGMKDAAGNCGYEVLENRNLEELAKAAAQSAVTMLHAQEMVGQKCPVILHNGFGGVILHEACGHALEASSVAKGISVFTGKFGTQIASPLVTAIDDGTIKNEWGSENFDDEGNPQQKRVLIKDGILNSYMIDEKNNRIMKTGCTSSGRRQSYKYCPTSRMSNTFIQNGESSFEDIISSTKYALFAKSMGGGSVNPATGEFNFAVNEGYMVIDGKIAYPVKGATLVGNGADALKYVDMVGNNCTLAYGMCGASSGSIPTCVGQPTIRLSEMTVGGKGGKSE